MKVLDSLEDVISFVKTKHRSINKQGNGVYGMKFLRKPNGHRIMFEEIQGMKLFDWKVNGTELTIHQLAVGLEHGGKKRRHTLSSTLILRDLVMINVYDHCTQFYSYDSIDFAYVEEEYTSNIEHMTEWLHDETGILRAQWLSPNKHIDRILEEISVGRTIERKIELPRQIDMGCEDL